MSDRVSRSRLGRLGKMANLARKALPVAVQRWRESGPNAKASEALIASSVVAAEDMLETLGELKGLALKVGQMMSYMDGALPDSIKPTFQKTLRRLQSQAPPMSWEAIEGVLQEELGDIDEHFAHIEHTPLAAASIGQVHRATLHDGSAVAVKIQYPGVEQAISADMNNLGFMKGLAAPLLAMLGASGNTKLVSRVLGELRDRLLEECDYEREARMQAAFAEKLSDDPVLYVPRVFTEHSTRRVLVSEFIEGRELAEVCGPESGISQETRNRWAAALCRVTSVGLYEWGLLHADPHPGNYLFMPDERLCLLDFGCVKEMPDSTRMDMRGYVRAAIVAARSDAPQDWAEFDRQVAAALKFDPNEAEVWALARGFLLYCLEPIIYDRPHHFSEAYARGSVDMMLEGKRELLFPDGRRVPKIPKMPPMPPDYVMVNRLQWGFFSVLKELDATVNWHAELPADLRA
ncbi:MAG: AarF/ABC1/UbiB kinase family protein [Nannocystaceae bacterium]